MLDNTVVENTNVDVKSIVNEQESQAKKKLFDFSKEEKNAFKRIDRKQEVLDVLEYQKNGDEILFEKLYNNRIQTLQIWARKYYYVGASREDVFTDLSAVFFKAVVKFVEKKLVNGKMKRMPAFNTYLFTSLKHHVINQWNKKRVNKRTTIEGIPGEDLTLSLDFPYDHNGSNCTLIDIVPNKKGKDSVIEEIAIKDAINVLSQNKPELKEFLVNLSKDEKITTLLKTLKRTKGRLRLMNKQMTSFEKKDEDSRFSHIDRLIRERKSLKEEFEVIGYEIKGNFVNYEIELNKTDRHSKISKEIRNLRKNKEYYLKKIKGISHL